MADVITLDCMTTLDIPPERVLQGALDNKISHAVVIGITPEGELYFASAIGSLGDTLILLERAKDELMDRSRATPFQK